MRSRAVAVLAVFGASTVVGVLLFVLVDPGVQLVGVEELVRRHADAVAYFTLDYLFIVIYGVVAPVVLWRFGASLPASGGRAPVWVRAAALCLLAGGVFDAAENTLLLLASSNGEAGWVTVAHGLAIPKYALGGLGFLLALRAVAIAVGVVREGRAT